MRGGGREEGDLLADQCHELKHLDHLGGRVADQYFSRQGGTAINQGAPREVKGAAGLGEEAADGVLPEEGGVRDQALDILKREGAEGEGVVFGQQEAGQDRGNGEDGWGVRRAGKEEEVVLVA